MRKLFKIVLALFAVITVSTACNGNSENPIVYTTIGTLVQGSASVGTPYYAVFDDGVKGFVDNTSLWTPPFKEYEVNELRFMISYTILDKPAPAGFDRTINISQARMITSDKLSRVSETDFQGEKGLNTYRGDVKVDEGYYSPAMGYITLLIVYPINNETFQHTMRLVYNAGNEGYKAMYEDDGYLWLELYHHDGGDSESFLRGAYASYKIDERSLGVTMTDYKGLKIISKGIDSNEPHIFTLDFAQ